MRKAVHVHVYVQLYDHLYDYLYGFQCVYVVGKLREDLTERMLAILSKRMTF